jgi:hypothetical protein
MWMIIGAIIIVGGAFVFAEYRNVIQAQTEYTAPAVSAYSVNATSTAIADNDWQKVLVGTNPAAAKQKSLGGGTTLTQSQPLTETEKLGQSIISDYLQLKQSGGSASTSTINAIISHALNNQNITPAAKVYDFSDIKIGKDDGATSTLIYGITLGTLFNNNNTQENDEAVDARDSVEQNDPTILAKIDPIIAAYKNILNGLLAMTAPPTLAKIHLDFINAMSERLSTAELLRKINSDPVAGLRGAGQYMNGLNDLSDAFQELQRYFGTRGINFGTTTTSSTVNGQSGQ